jgi:hypothetical protein
LSRSSAIIFFAHLALDRLLRGADGPDRQVMDFGEAVRARPGLLVVDALILLAILHERDFVETSSTPL